MSPTYSMDELVALTGIPARTIRHYIKEGLLPKTRYASNATTYSRETLGLLGAILQLRRGKGVSIPVHARKLRALPPDDVEALAEELDPQAQDDEGEELTVATTATATATPAATATATATATPTATATLETAERWLRVPLLPGLDLMLLDGSGDVVTRIAHEIQSRYRATAKPR